MLKKNEVYVTVDSPKVAKKLKKVLDMFGENTFDNEVIQDALRAGGNVHFWNKLSWAWGHSSDKTKVTVKQLKQILFREHAKKGDVVIVDNGKFGSRWVLELTGNNVNIFEHSNSFDLKTGENDFDKFGKYIMDGKFIRYATEEEKALLNPVKGLETGNWYWLDRRNGGVEYRALIFFQGHKDTYGFNHGGDWTNGYRADESILKYNPTVATKEEVETALRKEAEKRGFVKGAVFQGVQGAEKDMRIPIEEIHYSYGEYCGLYSGNSWLYLNGKWAEVIEQEKTLEQRVKELEDFVYNKK